MRHNLHRSPSGRHRAAQRVAPLVAVVLAVLATPAMSAGAGPLQVAMMQGARSCVAMTFDDGPDVRETPRLLAVLEAKHAAATFFVVGQRAATWPDIVMRAAADGNEIGNHSWDHASLPGIETDAALREITRTDAVIQRLIGHPPAYLRAPYGAISVRVAALTPRTFVAWSVDSLDWKGADAAHIAANAVNRVTNGGIILMHDTHARTIDAVPAVIDGLRARGFRLVTVSELLGGGCGGSPIGYSLPGQTPPREPPSPPLVSSAAPLFVDPPVQAATHRPRYRILDDEDDN
jgi:peptidoglycan/xylan/chitin deacetylase (PgdA/CDA1 family)